MRSEASWERSVWKRSSGTLRMWRPRPRAERKKGAAAVRPSSVESRSAWSPPVRMKTRAEPRSAATSTPVMVTDNEGWRNEHVHLPALTREQLDPVYTQLSKAGRDFPEGSGAAKMLRQEADKFLDSLRKLPAKHASRNLDKKTGLVSYGVTLLLENSTVTKGGGGSLEIQGAAVSSSQNANPDDVSHLFRDEPK